MPHALVTPVLDRSVRGLCARPYEGHPRGCPNFGKVSRCPPAAPLLFDAFDERGPFYVIYSRFPLGEHVRAMRERHPDWSDRQLRCVHLLAEQVKKLREDVDSFKKIYPEVGWKVETTPEAMGLDVAATLRQAGVDLEWPPHEVATHVALAGRVAGIVRGDSP